YDLLAIVGCVQRLLTSGADASTTQPVFDLVGAKEGAVTFTEGDLGFVHRSINRMYPAELRRLA
ncbi:hypothetical protein C0043_41805, partial [Pseudomonas aeruginosa]